MGSKIFTKCEEESLYKRLNGVKSDSTGIFSARVKPKILEILDWFRRKDDLEKIIKRVKK